MEAEGFQDTGDEVWPDNALVVQVFVSMMTQWRVGPGGVVGLDYGVLPIIEERRGVPREERSFVFDGLRVMEASALEELRKSEG
nr:DUF1799 domain-containing protein [Desulfobulbus rhabdoformis]